MKAITTRERLPKYLVVNEIPEKRSWNKHLPKPYKQGEVVQVAPFEEPVRNKQWDDVFQFVKPNDNPMWFRQRYVVVYRKGDDGKFSYKCTECWESFDLLTRN